MNRTGLYEETRANPSTTAPTTCEMREQTRVAVSVVVPCYNESESIDQLKTKLFELIELGSDRYQLQFVLVNDGSTDETSRLLKQQFGNIDGFRVIDHEQNQGISAAIRTGIIACESEIVCSIDSDCTYPPVLLLKLIPMLDEDVAIVTASPYHPDGAVKNVPGWRVWLSKTASSAYGILLRQNINCYTCAFRVYRRSLIAALSPGYHGYAGTVEWVWLVSRKGYRIVEHPATLDVRQFGQTKMRTLSVARRHLRLMTRIIASKIFG